MNLLPNIVIPIGGSGQRFIDAGYTTKKPFIDVNGKTMLERAMECFSGKIIVVAPTFKTQGATETVLLIQDQIDNDTPLVIASCDQVFIDIDQWMAYFYNYDGGLLCFKNTDPKWSYIGFAGKYVTRVEEKNAISDYANVGVYYWKRGSDFVKYARQMIAKNIRINGEFYNAPVYNEAIADGKKIVWKVVDKMVSLGTPEDLEAYVKPRRNGKNTK